VALEADPGNGSASPFGQYAIGTFVADATTQAFATNGSAVAQVNAWQLRLIATPEPAWLTLGVPALAAIISRRRLH
jgi:hypothetical protein